MKVIALMPVKNEEWLLNLVLTQLKLFVDEIVVLDDHSTDNTINILKSYDVIIKHHTESTFSDSHSATRQKLLDIGRKRGGTHFVFLDADEAFTTNFLNNFRSLLKTLKPGQKVLLEWLCLWKSAFKYRKDNSVWSNNFKDFIFCDDGFSNYTDAKFHEGRTPEVNNEDNTIKIDTSQGAVLHFQFVPFKRFQMKQAHKRCRDIALDSNLDAIAVNRRYEITLDDNNAKCVDIPAHWIKNLKGISKLKDADVGWYYQDILRFFSQKGIEFFEPLQIWHVPELYDEFVKQVGREPRSNLQPPKSFFSRVVEKRLIKIIKNFLEKI
jgi:glycosyltransferase involved in cell wall biosynthesis